MRGGCRMEKIDEGLKTLVDAGKSKGYLTFDQVNEYLPDEAVNPDKLDNLLLALEEQGIELVDEATALEREGKTEEADAEADAEPGVEEEEEGLSFLEEED